MTPERKTELAKQLVAIIFELTSAGEMPSDVMPVQQPKKPVEMLTLKERLDIVLTYVSERTGEGIGSNGQSLCLSAAEGGYRIRIIP